MINLNEIIEEVKALEESNFHPFKWVLEVEFEDLMETRNEILHDIHQSYNHIETLNIESNVVKRIRKGVEYKENCLRLIEDRIFIEG